MTEIQAALGIWQLQRLDDPMSRREVLVNRYDELLKGLPLLPPARALTKAQQHCAATTLQMYFIS